MLSLSPKVAYIHEPLNPLHRPGTLSKKTENWFQFICQENALQYTDDIANCLRFRYHFSNAARSARTTKDLALSFREYISSIRNSLLRKRPLVKDPFAIFSTEWLASCFDMEPVIVIRHPAAFAGSLKRAGWSYPFKHFLNQPLLMERLPSSYHPQIEEYSQTNKDIIDQAILLWNIIHNTILNYRITHPNWLFVRHEDLSLNPVDKFHTLYRRLDLDFSPHIRKQIEKYSFNKSSDNGIHSLKRDSKSNIYTWKMRLSQREVDKVLASTRAIAREFYEEDHLTA